MGAAVPRWVVVDKLVHELGALRAVVREVEAQPDLAEHDVTLELRTSLARAADTIHLVIGGNEGMLDQAWRTIAEAQEVGTRVRAALDRSRVVGRISQALRDRANAQAQQTQRHIGDLQAMRDGTDATPGPTMLPRPRD